MNKDAFGKHVPDPSWIGGPDEEEYQPEQDAIDAHAFYERNRTGDPRDDAFLMEQVIDGVKARILALTRKETK